MRRLIARKAPIICVTALVVALIVGPSALWNGLAQQASSAGNDKQVAALPTTWTADRKEFSYAFRFQDQSLVHIKTTENLSSEGPPDGFRFTGLEIDGQHYDQHSELIKVWNRSLPTMVSASVSNVRCTAYKEKGCIRYILLLTGSAIHGDFENDDVVCEFKVDRDGTAPQGSCFAAE